MGKNARSVSRKRITALTALAVGAAFALTGCISGSPTSDDDPEQSGDRYSGEIEWWTINLQKNFGAYIQDMIDTYEEEHPEVTINWVDVPGQDITTKLLAAIASGKLPDAVNFNSTTKGLFADSMSDLGEYFTPDEIAEYAPGLTDPLTDEDGVQYAIPWYNGGTNLAFYNTQLLSSTGFDPASPPETYEEALELAQEYHDASGAFGTNFMAYSNIVQANDLPLISKDKTEAAFNTSETTELLETFKQYFDSGAIAPGALSADIRNLPQTLDNEQVALEASMTSSNLANIQKNAPSVYETIAVAAPVVGPSGKYYMPAQQAFGIPAKSDNKAAAAEWLKFVTSPENQLAFCKLVAIYPSTLKTMEDPFFTDITGDTPADQAREVLRDTFANSVDASLGTGNDEQFRELFDEQVRAYMSGQKSVTQALDDAETAWNTELAKER